jgi:hypothetical protein
MKPAKVIVILLGVALFVSLTAQTSLLTEQFEGAFPPPGWSTSQTQGNDKWNSNTFYGRPNYTPGANGQCADNDDESPPNNSRTGNNRLISPTFDATYYDIVWLAYDVDWYPVGTQLSGTVEVYNGASWVMVMNHGFSRKTVRDSINISTHVAGKATGRVRFVYNETSGGVNSKWYEVDDVNVWASDYNPPPPPDTLDLAITAIVRPNDYEPPDVPFIPACQVSNNLDTTAHATVLCRITDINTGGMVYEDIKNNHSLSPGNTVVEFAAFTPQKQKNYHAYFEVSHPDDGNPGNNIMYKNFTTIQDDVTPYRMDEPTTPDQINPFPPTAWYAERMGRRVDDVLMRCIIEDLLQENRLYDDSVAYVTFDPFDTVQAIFDTAYLSTGTFIITFWAKSKYGVNISRPSLVDTFDYIGITEDPVADQFYFDGVTPGITKDAARISFTLGEVTDVNLRVFDVSGKLITTLISGTRDAGAYTINWDTRNAPSGVYFVKLTTPRFSAHQKVLVLH